RDLRDGGDLVEHRPGRGPEIAGERAGQPDHDEAGVHLGGSGDDGAVVVDPFDATFERGVRAGQHAGRIGDREPDAALAEVDAETALAGPAHAPAARTEVSSNASASSI